MNIPIEGTWNKDVRVEVDPSNPKHRDYIGQDSFVEKQIVHGLIHRFEKLLDPLVLNDAPNTPSTKSSVYVIFFEDMGDYYQPYIADPSDVRINKKKMNERIGYYLRNL